MRFSALNAGRSSHKPPRLCGMVDDQLQRRSALNAQLLQLGKNRLGTKPHLLHTLSIMPLKNRLDPWTDNHAADPLALVSNDHRRRFYVPHTAHLPFKEASLENIHPKIIRWRLSHKELPIAWTHPGRKNFSAAPFFARCSHRPGTAGINMKKIQKYPTRSAWELCNRLLAAHVSSNPVKAMKSMSHVYPCKILGD